MGGDPGAELGEDTEVEAGILQAQSERVGPREFVPHRFSSLSVGQVLRHLLHRDQCQAAR